MNVKPIKATTALNDLKTGVKNAAKKTKEHLVEHKDDYAAAGLGAAAIGGFGAIVHGINKASGNSDSNYEIIKHVGASDYIERVGDKYNLVHMSYDGSGSVTMPIDPSEYAFYGIKPNAATEAITAELSANAAVDSPAAMLGAHPHTSEVFNSMLNLKPASIEDVASLVTGAAVGMPVSAETLVDIPKPEADTVVEHSGKLVNHLLDLIS